MQILCKISYKETEHSSLNLLLTFGLNDDVFHTVSMSFENKETRLSIHQHVIRHCVVVSIPSCVDPGAE